MTEAAYTAWVGRAHAHQQAQRPIDALLCYRRALRETPNGLAARLQLGRILWHLGRQGDAVEHWQAAATAHPRDAEVQVALAEASLTSRAWPEARAAALNALALAPDLPRADFIAACATLALDASTQSASEATEAIVAALNALPALLGVPALAGALASTLDGARPELRIGVLDAILAAPALCAELRNAPAPLLAIAVESVPAPASAPLWPLLDERVYGFSEHDALRRIARVAAERSLPSAGVLVTRYAQLCLQAFGASVPLLWPQRTAGVALRVIALASDTQDLAVAHELVRAFEATWTIALLEPEGAAGSEREAAVRTLTIGGMPSMAEARALAALDADVVIDLTSLRAAVGPLLAARPGRLMLGLAEGGIGAPTPLVDVSVEHVDALLAALQRAADANRSAVAAADEMPTAFELAARFSRAVREHQEGDFAAALADYDSLLAKQLGAPQVHYLRGVLRRDTGDARTAREDFVAALTGAPRYIDARVAASQLALEQGEPIVARELASAELAEGPGYTSQWRALGLAELALGRDQVARAAFERAVALDVTDAESHYNLGVALQTLRRLGEASRAYQRALALRPDFVAADYNLGVIFQEQKHFDASIAAFEEVLRHDPKHARAYKNLGEVLFAAGRLDAWRANFLRFEKHCPDALGLAVQALEVCQHFADLERVDRYLDNLRNERFAAPPAASELAELLEELLYLLLFFDTEPETIHRFALTYDAAAQRVYGKRRPSSAARRPGRIRVGYLSADLRNHVMGKMMWEAVRRHDRDHFEISFFSLSQTEDEWTTRYRGAGDRFEKLAELSDTAAARRIAEFDLDVLVDLGTHTRGARPGILARGPARVQITHVASAGTVGLSAVDFKLTDAYADVPENQAQTIERLLPMRGCVYPYRHVAPAQDAIYSRERLGIAADAVVIGAFVTALKLSRRCLRLWAEVLQRLPRARLAISPVNPALARSYVRLVQRAGIAPERLVLIPQGRDDGQNQARYRLVDFVLDPMPYGGANGTLEALDMGVPVVTLCGRRHSERTSYSILANLGVLDTVAHSGPEYVDCAVRLGEDPVFMAEVRGRIRERLPGSALADMAQHTRHLEAAYVAALDLSGVSVEGSM